MVATCKPRRKPSEETSLTDLFFSLSSFQSHDKIHWLFQLPRSGYFLMAILMKTYNCFQEKHIAWCCVCESTDANTRSKKSGEWAVKSEQLRIINESCLTESSQCPWVTYDNDHLTQFLLLCKEAAAHISVLQWSLESMRKKIGTYSDRMEDVESLSHKQFLLSRS